MIHGLQGKAVTFGRTKLPNLKSRATRISERREFFRPKKKKMVFRSSGLHMELNGRATGLLLLVYIDERFVCENSNKKKDGATQQRMCVKLSHAGRHSFSSTHSTGAESSSAQPTQSMPRPQAVLHLKQVFLSPQRWHAEIPAALTVRQVGQIFSLPPAQS